MTQQLIPYEPAPAQSLDLMTLGKVLSTSGYFQDARDAAQAIVKVLAGQELGIGAIAAMTGLYIVKGRVTMSANLMAAQIKRSGKYNYQIARLDDKACEIVFLEQGREIGRSLFTAEDAKTAGLWGSSEPWKKTPRNMLFARAMSNGAKWYCPDVFSGPVYTPDELRDESAPVAELPPAPAADPQTGEIEDCDGERTLLKQLRDDLKTVGGTPRALTQRQVLAMSCDQIREEIEATGASLDAIRAQQAPSTGSGQAAEAPQRKGVIEDAALPSDLGKLYDEVDALL